MPIALDSRKVEEFVRWFLRFNGYFGIENFIVHAAYDKNRIRDGVVGNVTETDTIAVRMPYSREISGSLYVANFDTLVQGSERRHDVVIAEAKSGVDNRPNEVWKGKEGSKPIEYLVRFIGLHHKEEEIRTVAESLLSKYVYEDSFCRFRYVIFSKQPNNGYAQKGITYITFDNAVNFLVSIRGQSWLEANTGVASVHHQWNDILKKIFDVANDSALASEKRLSKALSTFYQLCETNA